MPLSPKAQRAYQNMDENIGKLLVIIADEPQNARDMREGWEAARLLGQGPDVETLQAELPEQGRAILRLLIREAKKAEFDFKRGMQIKPSINDMWEYVGVAKHAQPFAYNIENYFKRINSTMNTRSRKSYVIMSAKAYGVRRTKSAYNELNKALGQAANIANALNKKAQVGKRKDPSAPGTNFVSKAEVYKLSQAIRLMVTLVQRLPKDYSYFGSDMLEGDFVYLNKQVNETISKLSGPIIEASYDFEHVLDRLDYFRKKITEAQRIQNRT